MAQHVRVNAELERGLFAQSGHHLCEARAGERRRSEVNTKLIRALAPAAPAFHRPLTGARLASRS